MIAIPAFIDPESWEGFCEMRKSKGKSRPFTERAAKMILKELYKLKEAGQDPNAVLDQSTRNGWSDVYPVKDKGRAESFRERDARLAKERYDEMTGRSDFDTIDMPTLRIQ